MAKRGKWILLVSVVELALGAGPVAVALWPRENRVTMANYRRIEAGMALAEVERVLGPASGHERWQLGDVIRLEMPPEGIARVDNWQADGLEIAVGFDDAGNVVGYSHSASIPINDTPLDILKYRIIAIWQKWFP